MNLVLMLLQTAQPKSFSLKIYFLIPIELCCKNRKLFNTIIDVHPTVLKNMKVKLINMTQAQDKEQNLSPQQEKCNKPAGWKTTSSDNRCVLGSGCQTRTC